MKIIRLTRIYPTDIWVTNMTEKGLKSILMKNILSFTAKHARRTKHKRNEVISKALELINSPSKYAKTENYGVLKYIKGMKLDRKTGELSLEKKNSIPVLDEELIREEEKFDGYYSIVSSELDMSDTDIIETYKGLWKIEESFKITKTILMTRPIYVKQKPI